MGGLDRGCMCLPLRPHINARNTQRKIAVTLLLRISQHRLPKRIRLPLLRLPYFQECKNNLPKKIRPPLLRLPYFQECKNNLPKKIRPPYRGERYFQKCKISLPKDSSLSFRRPLHHSSNGKLPQFNNPKKLGSHKSPQLCKLRLSKECQLRPSKKHRHLYYPLHHSSNGKLPQFNNPKKLGSHKWTPSPYFPSSNLSEKCRLNLLPKLDLFNLLPQIPNPEGYRLVFKNSLL